ncbi:MAG: hypothetical protein F6K11_02630 [Leptolyngbya sp. SIO3F4]|nr:hypothetical protein [Leptolyngbya sp. SIO3F4]
MKTLPLRLSLIALGLVIVGCSSRSQTQSIQDASTQQKIVLTKENNEGNVYGLTVRMRGNISGEADISLMLSEDKAYYTETVSGDVQFRWRGDWYADEIEILYEPKTETSGSIDIKYDFWADQLTEE